MKPPLHALPWILLGLAAGSAASPVSREPLQAVLARAQSVVVVEVAGVGERQREGYWQWLTLQARPLRTLSGPAPTVSLLHCRHAQGMPHRRGDSEVWPLLSGSGMEFDLRRGETVILLIAAAASPGDCEILRVEPLHNEAAILAEMASRHPGE